MYVSLIILHCGQIFTLRCWVEPLDTWTQRAHFTVPESSAVVQIGFLSPTDILVAYEELGIWCDPLYMFEPIDLIRSSIVCGVSTLNRVSLSMGWEIVLCKSRT